MVQGQTLIGLIREKQENITALQLRLIQEQREVNGLTERLATEERREHGQVRNGKAA